MNLTQIMSHGSDVSEITEHVSQISHSAAPDNACSIAPLTLSLRIPL